MLFLGRRARDLRSDLYRIVVKDTHVKPMYLQMNSVVYESIYLQAAMAGGIFLVIAFLVLLTLLTTVIYWYLSSDPAVNKTGSYRRTAVLKSLGIALAITMLLLYLLSSAIVYG